MRAQKKTNKKLFLPVIYTNYEEKTMLLLLLLAVVYIIFLQKK